MAVKKINGFLAPYRSQTFQQQAGGIVQTSGLMSMDGDISTAGGNVIIPPFTFIQNGLIVVVDGSKTEGEPLESSPPYFLSVTAQTSSDVDDLLFTFPKSPEDISDNSVIIGYWDGIEWRKPQMVSIAEVYRDILRANIDFERIGPFSGLLTYYSSPNFETEGGIIVDRQGLRNRRADH